MKRILVKMTCTLLGQDVYDNGIAKSVEQYVEGKQYSIGEHLADCFIVQDACVLVRSEKPVPSENKAIDPVKENKTTKKKRGRPRKK